LGGIGVTVGDQPQADLDCLFGQRLSLRVLTLVIQVQGQVTVALRDVWVVF
jgi:hypothetical protein